MIFGWPSLSLRAMNRIPLTDEDLMPPPSRLYVHGSREFEEALERGLIAVSGPSSPRRQKSPLSVALRSCSDPTNSSLAPMALMHERGGVAGTEYKEQPSSQIMHGASSEFPRLELQGSTTGCGDLHADDNDACKENEMFESDTSLSFQTEHMSSAASTNCRAAMPEATRLCDIVGHDNAKLRIEEVLLSISPRFSRFMTGIRALPASILLSGPPGCGKTKLARAIAGEARAAFLSVSPSDILSKYVGESESRMRAVFTEAWDQACLVESRTAVLFFDEIDALGQARGGGGGGPFSQVGGGHGGGEGCSRRVLAELLSQLTALDDQLNNHRSKRSRHPLQSRQATTDSPSSEDTDPSCCTSQPQIIVVAATNRTDDCDEALLRRFGIQLHVGLPTCVDREKLLVRLLDGVSHNVDAHQIGQLATLMQGRSGSDLEFLTREAVMAPVRECIRSANELRNSPRDPQSPTSPGSSCAYWNAVSRDESVHDYLETRLKSLRPVCMQDFVDAHHFFCTCGDLTYNASDDRGQ